MDFVGPKAKERHDHKLKIIIGGHIHAVTGCAGAFVWVRVPIQIAKAICVGTLYRRRERIGCIGTDCDIEVGRIGIRNRFETVIQLEEAEYHTRGFILNGWDTGQIHFGFGAAVPSIRVLAVSLVVSAGCGVTDPEARGVLENDPGE